MPDFAEIVQTTVNGLASGSIFALGAIGLSLVYGILKLVNFAHGDFMTLGGYAAFVVVASAGLSLVVGIVAAMAIVAALGLLLEKGVWRPMRLRGAGIMQLLLMSLGLAFVLRNLIQFFWRGDRRDLLSDEGELLLLTFFDGAAISPFDTWRVTDDINLGYIKIMVMIGAGIALVAVALMLRFTTLGKTMRALSDSVELAEISGINTRRVITWTWVLAGSLAGLAGVFAAVFTSLSPDTGWFLLLGIFAAVVLGGIGNAYGALIGGLALGLVQEWSTMFIEPTWKEAVGFGVLIIVLLIRPQGILGHNVREA